jgi:hypothetical protein
LQYYFLNSSNLLFIHVLLGRFETKCLT